MENQNQKKADAIYDARELGRGRMLLLGLQHMFAMFGATVLVPILVNSYFHGEGLSVQVTLFMAGARPSSVLPLLFSAALRRWRS